jgi:hypothetical protein
MKRCKRIIIWAEGHPHIVLSLAISKSK